MKASLMTNNQTFMIKPILIWKNEYNQQYTYHFQFLFHMWFTFGAAQRFNPKAFVDK